MQAVNYYIIVKKIKVEPKKVGGLILTEKTDTESRYKKAEILSIGNLVEGVKQGDIVHYDRHAGHAISFNDVVYQVLKIGDVVLVEWD